MKHLIEETNAQRIESVLGMTVSDAIKRLDEMREAIRAIRTEIVLAVDPITAAIDAVAAIYGVTPAQIKSRERPDYIIAARHAVYTALHEMGLSSHVIGGAMERDHSSIVHGLRAFHNRLATDRREASRFEKVRVAVGELKISTHARG